MAHILVYENHAQTLLRVILCLGLFDDVLCINPNPTVWKLKKYLKSTPSLHEIKAPGPYHLRRAALLDSFCKCCWQADVDKSGALDKNEYVTVWAFVEYSVAVTGNRHFILKSERRAAHSLR